MVCRTCALQQNNRDRKEMEDDDLCLCPLRAKF